MIARPAFPGGWGERGEQHGQPAPPSEAVFSIALALVIVALLGYFITIPFVAQFQFLLAVLGYVVRALGCVL